MVRRGPDFDLTLEEALHLVTQFGYAETYPEDFGEYAGSRIADLMGIARGGRFARVPRRHHSRFSRTGSVSGAPGICPFALKRHDVKILGEQRRG